MSVGSFGLRRLGSDVAAGLLVSLLAVSEIQAITRNHGLGSDFAGTFFHPAQAVVHGRTPFGDPRIPGPLAGSVYPPSAFVPVAWIGLLPRAAAVSLWLVLLAVAAATTLWVLGVRDPRRYMLWLLTPMILSTAAIGNATILVIFLMALLWVCRDSPDRAAAALTAGIAIKLFVAPLIVWLLVTRRFRAAAYAAVATPLVILAAWSVIDFSAVGRYPSILSENRHVFGADGPFLQSLVLQLGGGWDVALAAGIASAAILLIAALFVGDIGAFTLAATASILIAPVAWIGYMGLLVVPVAFYWKRFSAAWAVLLIGTYVHWYHSPIPYKSAALSTVTLGLLAAVVVLVLWRERCERTAGALRTAPGAV